MSQSQVTHVQYLYEYIACMVFACILYVYIVRTYTYTCIHVHVHISAQALVYERAGHVQQRDRMADIAQHTSTTNTQ